MKRDAASVAPHLEPCAMVGRISVYFLLALCVGQTSLAEAQSNTQMPGPYVYQPPGVAPAYSLPDMGPKGPPGTGKPDIKGQNPPPAPAYSAIGSQSFGADGTSYTRAGDSVFGSDGSVSQTVGPATIMTKPDGTTRSCQTIGTQTVCN